MNEREGQSEHIEATAGTVRQLQSDIPSVTGTMGTRSVEWYGKVFELTNESWVWTPGDGDQPSNSSGEGTT